MEDYYRIQECEPLTPAPPSRRAGKRGRAALRFICALLLLAGAVLGIRLAEDRLPAAELPPPLETGGLPPETVPAPGAGAPPVSRAPLGDGTTLTLVPRPEEEPWSLQDIYRENLPSIVSVRGSHRGGYSLGSGVVMTSDGYIITNSHVIEGCSRLDVVLWDDRTYPAALVGRDGQTDLAVLKISCTGLTPAEFGDSADLEVGDMAVAIGNPLGDELRGTMTDGIISAINRDVNVEGRTMTLIQTNAALNSGNSGGALINAYGQVVGITNMKMQSYTTPVEGLGFAIPTATVKTIVDILIEKGVVGGRPTIGVTVQTVSAGMRAELNCPQGVYVASVEERSDAWAKGLRPGDVITHANGREIAATEDLLAAKSGLEAGDVLTLRFWREGDYQTVDVALVEQYVLDSFS